MSEWRAICTQCGGEWQSVTDEWLDGVAIRGHYECDRCGAAGGLWWDGGTVDLDQVRAATPADDSSVWVGPTLDEMLEDPSKQW